MLRLALLMLLVVLCTGSDIAQAQESRLPAIASSKTIRIAYRNDAAPFSFVGAYNDPTGYTIEICQSVVAGIQRRLKLEMLKIEWVPVTIQNRFDAVAQGNADLECGSSTVTLSRLEQVDFSSIIFVESTGVLVKRDAGLSTAQELAGKKIAVIGGTTNERALRTIYSGDQAMVVPVKAREEGIALLEKGAVDAFASDKLLLVGSEFQNPRAIMMLPDDLSVEPYAIVLPRGDAALRLAVNAAFAEAIRSGEVVKIYDKWFGQKGLRRTPLLNAVYLLGAIPD